jgi:hypothetical protein
VRFDDEMEKALYFAVGAAATAVNRTADRMWSWSMIITLLSHWLAASFFDRLHTATAGRSIYHEDEVKTSFCFHLFTLDNKTGVREVL